MSPRGESCSTKCPLSTTRTMPAKASADPAICRRDIRSPRYARLIATAVHTGAVQTISETFEAGAYSRAIFSVRK